MKTVSVGRWKGKSKQLNDAQEAVFLASEEEQGRVGEMDGDSHLTWYHGHSCSAKLD